MAALLGAALLSACDKGTDLNVDLPSATSINTRYTDTPLETTTVRFDSLETLKSDHYLAGRYADNITGTTTATALLNLQISSLTDSLPSKFVAPVLDSVLFIQGFSAVYGQASVPAVFDLLELTAPLSETRAYTSASVPDLNTTPLALNLVGRLDRRLRLPQNKSDSVAGTFRYLDDPTLRLTLLDTRRNVRPGEAFANRFFSALSLPVFGPTELTAALTGLAVVPAAGYDRAVVSFGRSLASRLVFYFHDPAATARPLAWHSYSVLFGASPGGTGAARPNDPRYYTYLTTDFGPSPLAPLADPTQQVLSAGLNGLAYVQDGAGLGVRVRIPAVLATALTTNRQIINRAEIYLPVKPFTNAVFPYATGLFMSEVDSRNQVLRRVSGLLATDRIVQRDGAAPTGSGNEVLAVLYDANTSAPYYLLPVTSYLQYYLNNLSTHAETVPDGLLLAPTVRRSQNLTLNRSVLDVDGSRGGPRLRVYYSQLR